MKTLDTMIAFGEFFVGIAALNREGEGWDAFKAQYPEFFQPQLAVTSVAGQSLPNGSYQVRVTVQNTGRRTSTTSHLMLYDSQAHYSKTEKVGPIARGQSVIKTLTLTKTASANLPHSLVDGPILLAV